MSLPGKIAVIGAGAWGTVFSQILADATGNEVHLWARRTEVTQAINHGCNTFYVPELSLHQIKADTDLAAVIDQAQIIVIAIPSNTVRQVLAPIRSLIRLDATLVSLVKGLEAGSLQFMTEVISQVTGVNESRIIAVSGPNLSKEIAQKEPTGAVVAGSDLQRCKRLATLIQTHYFQPFLASDVIGVEVGGVVKNIVAMAVGAAAGMGLGINSRSFIINRGLAEMARLGVALGAEAETFLGLSGLGDLVATCSSEQSRNFSFGYRVGQGLTVEEALAASTGTVEGARSCPVVVELAQKLGVKMPIANAANLVINGEATLAEVQVQLEGGPIVTDGHQARRV